MYRHKYFEVLGLLISEIRRRFHQPSFTILHDIERLLVNSCNATNVEFPQSVADICAADLKVDCLRVQLSMLPDVIRTANKECGFTVNKVTSLTTICEIFNACEFPKTMLNEVHRLLRIYYTIPLTLATFERTFSGLRHFEDILTFHDDSKMTQSPTFLHTHQQRTYNFSLLKVAIDFVVKNNRRNQFFGQYIL